MSISTCVFVCIAITTASNGSLYLFIVHLLAAFTLKLINLTATAIDCRNETSHSVIISPFNHPVTCSHVITIYQLCLTHQHYSHSTRPVFDAIIDFQSTLACHFLAIPGNVCLVSRCVLLTFCVGLTPFMFLGLACCVFG